MLGKFTWINPLLASNQDRVERVIHLNEQRVHLNSDSEANPVLAEI